MAQGTHRARPPGALALLAFPLLIAAVGVASEPDRYLDSLNGAPPEVLQRLPPLPPPPGTGGARLAVLLLDGLGEEPSREVPALARLRAKGASVTLRAAYPSFTRPALATLLTGASPRLSGVRNNRHRGEVRLDTLLRRARAAGRHTACVADGVGFLADLAGDACETSEVTLDALGFLRSASRALSGPADVVFLHWVGLDRAGHAHGGASGEYQAAVRDLDALVDAVSELAPGRVLAVLGDHGHSRGGGHGGLEPEVAAVPLVLAGPGVARGATGVARAEDVAPTLALLGGVAVPASAEGAPIWDALALPAAVAAGAREHADAVRTRLWRTWAATLGLDDRRFPGFPALRTAALLAARPWWPRALRLGAAALALVLLILAAQRVARRLPWGWVCAGGFVPALAMALLVTRGDPLSFSAVEQAGPFLWRLLLYVLAGAAPVFMAGVGSCFRSKPGDRTRAAATVALATAAGAVSPWLLASSWAGFRPFPDLPGPTEAFLPVVLAAPAAAVLLAGGVLVAVGVWVDGAPPKKEKAPAARRRQPAKKRQRT